MRNILLITLHYTLTVNAFENTDTTMNHWSVMIMTNGDGGSVDSGENGDGCKDGTHTNPYKLITTHNNQ